MRSDYNYRKRLAGKRSQHSGALFEEMINSSCRYYERLGFCAIDKTPEDMKVLRQHDVPGQFVACFTKQAQPDYKGILADGTMILFDAKHTDSDRIRRSVITDTQEECFDRYERFGARCYIVVSLGFEHFFRIPWDHFRDMKQRLGHLYMNREELGPYEVKRQQGVLKILDGIELKGEDDDQDMSDM